MSLDHLSAEQRKAGQAVGQAKLRELQATAAELKHDWLDLENWAELAKEHGIRFPAKFVRPTPSLIARYLRKLNISKREFFEWGAYPSFERFAELNPRWPLYALVGILLEYVDERNAARDMLKAKLYPEN